MTQPITTATRESSIQSAVEAAKAAMASSKANTGNRTPPTTPSPNHTEPGCGTGPRTTRTRRKGE